MNRTTVVTALALAASLIAAPARAQNVGVTAAKGAFDSFTNNILKAAEMMPEADYAYKPTASVRTFGQLVGHVANAQRMFCAMALGEQPSGPDIEKTKTSKADLIAAFKETQAGCARAFAQTDAAAAAMGNMFGRQTSRLGMLITNAAHNAEHYGNIVTYMRMKGMTPPSSGGQ